MYVYGNDHMGVDVMDVRGKGEAIDAVTCDEAIKSITTALIVIPPFSKEEPTPIAVPYVV